MPLETASIIGVGRSLRLEPRLRRSRPACGPTGRRPAGRLDGFASELAAIGPQALAYPADVTAAANLHSALVSAIDELGAPEVLVYNAGMVRMNKPTEGDVENWAYTPAVNALGAKVAADAVPPALLDGRGSLLVTDGSLAHEPHIGYETLSMGKAPRRSYVHTLHDQLARHRHPRHQAGHGKTVAVIGDEAKHPATSAASARPRPQERDDPLDGSR